MGGVPEKAVISLTLQVWGANLLFPGMGNILKRDGQKVKRETQRKRKKLKQISYNDGVASGVLKGVRPALQTLFLATRFCVCVSLRES